MKRISSALSNEVYLTKDNNILKIYTFDSFKEIFSVEEKHIWDKLNYKYETLSLDKVFIYGIEHERFNDNDISDNDLFRVSRTLKEFHKLKIKNIKKAKFKIAHKKLIEETEEIFPLLENESKIVKKAIKILRSGKQVLLHNDIVEGNLLKVGKEIKLIDFEYSGFGNSIFDIASFITERSLTEHQELFFIECYDENISKEELSIVSAFLQIFWARWAKYKYITTNRHSNNRRPYKKDKKKIRNDNVRKI